MAGPAPAASQTATPGGETAPTETTEELVIPFPQDDGSLTPYSFDLGYPLVTLIYDTLLWRDTQGVPRPWLAKEVTTSPGGTTVTITLSEGVSWHDGRPLTAADVAFTFNYVAAHPHRRFTPQVAAVNKAVAVGDHTVELDLAHPVAGLAHLPLADLPILPRHRWQDLPPGQATPDGLPVGSGPYRLATYQPGESYELRGDPGYFRGPPAVDRLSVPIITTADQMLRAFRQGRADMLALNLPPKALRQVEGPTVDIARGTSYSGTTLVLNLDRRPFTDPEVRRAVRLALDPEAVAETVGGAVPATAGYLHPRSPWAPAADLTRTDPATARQVLAGRDSGPVELLYAEAEPRHPTAADHIARRLTEVGLTVSPTAVSPDELSQALTRGADSQQAAFQAALTHIPPLASYDPAFLAQLFATGAPLNHPGYASPRFDELARQITTTADRPARQQAVTQALNLLAEDVPALPLYFPTGAFAYRPGAYNNWTYIEGSGILDKQSFLPPHPSSAPSPNSSPTAQGPTPGSTPTAQGPSPTGPTTEGPSPPAAAGPTPQDEEALLGLGLNPLQLLAAGLLALAALLTAVQLIRR